MGLFTPSPQTSTSSGTSTTTQTYDPNVTNLFQQTIGPSALALANAAGADPQYHGQMVADQDPLFQEYQRIAGDLGNWQPQTANNSNAMIAASGDMYNTQVNPNTINLPQFNAQSFQPQQYNMPSYGNIPQITAPTAATPGQYQASQVSAPQGYTPQQINAMMVSGPAAVDRISGVPQINAPNLKDLSMQAAANISAPTLQNYSMQAAGPVSAQQINAPQSWTDPGVSQQYMSPYTQNVVNTQLAQAQVQEQQQLAQQGAQAAQAGAFGGSRGAVEAANTSIGYQQMAAGLEAQGLQSAYTQGLGQFNTQQQMAMQQQQANQAANLQAGLSNQQMQQQAATQNLASQLQTQGLGTNAYMQATLANNANQQQANLQNLSAALQTQGLGAQTGMQAAIANQGMSYQTQLANQQAQEWQGNLGQQAQLANQGANLQAQYYNQSAQDQAEQARMQYAYGASSQNAAAVNQAAAQYQQIAAQMNQYNAGMGMTAQQANQAAQMQGLNAQYQGNLSSLMQTQNLGLSGAEFGGNLGLQSGVQGYGLQQSQQGLNMNALMNSGALQNQAANLALSNYQTDLAGGQAVGQAGQAAQSWDQSVRDAQLQNWMYGMTLPMQEMGAAAQIVGSQPINTTSNTNYSGTSTMMPAQQSIFSQALGAGFGALGMAGGLGWKPFGAKGGRIPGDLQSTDGLGRTATMRAPSGGLGRKLMRYPSQAASGLEKTRLRPAVQHEPRGLGLAA